jgi:hypothetical protein
MTGKMPEAANDSNPQPKKRSAAAERALAEAEQRRKAQAQPNLPPEVGGRGGADPSRFGDWEVNGRAIDF